MTVIMQQNYDLLNLQKNILDGCSGKNKSFKIFPEASL